MRREAHKEGKVSELNKSLHHNDDVLKKISEILRVFHILAPTFLFFSFYSQDCYGIGKN